MTVLHTTLVLDLSTNDLILDALGNIALASAPFAVAQDVASQLRTFRGECWYDTSQGVPYWQQILGQKPPASLIAADIQNEALKVPDVVTATATFGGINSSRDLIGQVIVTDADSNTFALPL